MDSGQHTPSLCRSLDRDKVNLLSLLLSIPFGILGDSFSFVGVGAKTSIDFSISSSEAVILSDNTDSEIGVSVVRRYSRQH